MDRRQAKALQVKIQKLQSQVEDLLAPSTLRVGLKAAFEEMGKLLDSHSLARQDIADLVRVLDPKKSAGEKARCLEMVSFAISSCQSFVAYSIVLGSMSWQQCNV